MPDLSLLIWLPVAASLLACLVSSRLVAGVAALGSVAAFVVAVFADRHTAYCTRLGISNPSATMGRSIQKPLSK